MKIKIKTILFLLFLFLQVSTGAITQVAPIDTTFVDTTKSTEIDSTIIIYIKPILLIGSIDRTLTPEDVITDSTINFQNYRYIGDIISMQSGIFIRDFGSLGFLPDITFSGSDGRSVAYLSDGIQLNGLLSGLFNPYLYPTENIERIEVIQGTRAFLYGINSTGGAINFLSKSKKALKPYSRIRYSESGYGFSIVDGLVSQDIIRGLNVTTGVQHTVYGERYPNENYDCWNARVKARYNISSDLNLFASEMFNQTLLGLYSGVDLKETPEQLWYENMQAIVKNTDSYEKITRHDVQIGAAARVLPDSEAISTLTAYFTSNLRQYRDLESKPISNRILLDQRHNEKWFGVKLDQNFSFNNSLFNIGAEIQSKNALMPPAASEYQATHTSIFGKSEINISEPLKVSPYARFDNIKEQHRISYGGDVSIHPMSYLTLFSGYSRSFRFPTFQELIGTDTVLSSNIINHTPERHHLFESGLLWSNHEWYSIELKAFHRTIWNAITVTSQTSLNKIAPFELNRHQKKIIQGIAGTVSIRFGSFYTEGTAQFLEVIDHDDKQLTFPKWSAAGGIYFWDKIIKSHLDLKIGIHGKVFTSYYGREFNQLAQVYLPDGQGYDIQPAGVIDLMIIGQIGSAHIHFIFDNLLNRKYVMNTFYPMPERQSRFGVSWEFLN
ncbi:MAG: TonB-dependent receptor [Bacteroidota bacterium]|nr:TonB-dependent receptor [Bacteroidota bacterium]